MAKTRLQELATYKLKGTINEAVGKFHPFDSDRELVRYLDDKVSPIIRKKYDGKRYKGWILDYDMHVGTFMWVNRKSDLVLYCTPGWENYPGIPVNVSTEYGDDLPNDLSVKLGIDPSTELSGTAKEDAELVYDEMKNVVDEIIRSGLDKKYPYTGD